MKPRLDSIAICQDCGGVICHADATIGGIWRLEREWTGRGLHVERKERDTIRAKRQGHNPTCPRHLRLLEEERLLKEQYQPQSPLSVPEAV